MHLVKARRQRLDRLERRDDAVVLLARDLGRDEDAEMADFLMDDVDDSLAARADLALVAIDFGDPVQRLRRRRDVVALAGEDDDRRLDLAQIDRAAPPSTATPRCSLLPMNRFSTIQRISASFIM